MHKTNSHFRRGSLSGSVVFNCSCCGRSTRMTTQHDDTYCGECYDLLGLQNSLWDDGEAEFLSWGVKARDELVAKLVKRKGDLVKVNAYAPDLFAVGVR